MIACDDSTSSSASEVGDGFQELMYIFEAYLIMEIIFSFLLMSHNTEAYHIFVLHVCTSAIKLIIGYEYFTYLTTANITPYEYRIT